MEVAAAAHSRPPPPSSMRRSALIGARERPPARLLANVCWKREPRLLANVCWKREQARAVRPRGAALELVRLRGDNWGGDVDPELAMPAPQRVGASRDILGTGQLVDASAVSPHTLSAVRSTAAATVAGRSPTGAGFTKRAHRPRPRSRRRRAGARRNRGSTTGLRCGRNRRRSGGRRSRHRRSRP